LPAIITRLTRLTDTSLIVHWFSEDHGLIKTVAKGALRPKSAFAGKLDLFFEAEIDFAHARRGELHGLREVSIRNWREGLRKNYNATLLAAYCCQLLEASIEPEHPDPPLYDLLLRALNHIDTAGPSLRALLHFESELVKLLGIAHRQQTAECILRESLGRLPPTRKELTDRLQS
jgi:DNA repair protein RecO (recombination protein O)